MKKFFERIKEGFNGKKTGAEFIMMKVSEIKTDDRISGIFKINTEILKKITSSMKENGFDKSQPLVIGKIDSFGDFLVDGHTRLEASKRVGLEKVPIQIKYFEAIEDAIHYTYARQAERRNLTSAEILKAVKLLVKKHVRDGSGRSSEILAKKLGISSSTIAHVQYVEKNATSEDLNAIMEGKISNNEIYQKLKQKEKKGKRKTKKGKSKNKKILDSNEEVKENNTLTLINDVNKEEENIEALKNNKLLEEILRLLKKEKQNDALELILKYYSDNISNELLNEIKNTEQNTESLNENITL